MSKKIFYFALIAIIIAGMSTVTSCKKGENDPFLSLRSRKARITGEWKLSQGTITSSFTSGSLSGSSTQIYTGSTCTSDGNTYSYSENLTIKKDGTYEVVIVDDGFVYTVKGLWFFAGKIKDLDIKNKEAVVFSEQQYNESGYSETYKGLYGGDVMIIDQLKNKEIIFKGSFSYAGASGSTGTDTYDRTFEKL
jgi:hypothetical protein